MIINIKGPIIQNGDKWIYNLFEIDSTCPKDVQAVLNDAKGESLEIVINSGGGDIFAGSEIFTILKDYVGNSVVKIVGMAASAASVVAMAGKKVTMSPTAQLMIHNVSIHGASGDHRDMDHYAERLRIANESISNAYLAKTGKTTKELLELMDNETWFTADKALQNGFIDEIMFENAPTLANDVGFLIPESAAQSIKNERLKLRNAELENEKLKLEILKNGGSK